MIILNTSFSEKEKEVLLKYLGEECEEFEILSSVEGESFVLSDDGDYYYNDCFEPKDDPFFTQQKYEKLVPYRIIRFYHFYFMNCSDDENIWYRGRRYSNGNWRYDCYADSLEEMLEGL